MTGAQSYLSSCAEHATRWLRPSTIRGLTPEVVPARGLSPPPRVTAAGSTGASRAHEAPASSDGQFFPAAGRGEALNLINARYGTEPVGEVALPLPAQPRDPMRRNRVEEAFRNIEAPDVLEAVQQPVGVGGIAVRLELPEPDEPRHAGVGRLFEQMLKVSPKPGRDPLGDARFDPALRVHQRVGAEPLDRRRGRQDGSRVSRQASTNPAHQVLVRLRVFRFVGEPLDELTRRAAREVPESVQTAQFGQMLVPDLGPHRVVGELVPVQVELAADETHDGRRHELAGSQQAALGPWAGPWAGIARLELGRGSGGREGIHLRHPRRSSHPSPGAEIRTSKRAICDLASEVYPKRSASLRALSFLPSIL